MKQFGYPHLSNSPHENGGLGRLPFPGVLKSPKLIEAAIVLPPLCALILWTISLKYVNLRDMTDLGLISVLPASTILALVILITNFCLTLRQSEPRGPVVLVHLFLLIFMLYGVTTLVEEAPRFAVVYQHAGYTEYIMRTGSVDPGLDAYFSWPGFFVLSAFIVRIAGYHDILPLAAWAPVCLNLLYLGPLYIIFTSATTDKRLVWLGLLFFYLTNWVGQDYYSPQGLDFFFYLLIIAILLKWFKVTTAAQPCITGKMWRLLGPLSSPLQRLYVWLATPDTFCPVGQPRQRIALLTSLVILFAFVVFSHPLTPFFVLASVTVLVLFRRCTPRWLPVLMAIMIGAWLIIMARTFLAGHLNAVTGTFGQVDQTVSLNFISRLLQGSPQHIFIGGVRTVMTAALWGLAFTGAVLRLRRGYRDASYVLLAITPFSLLVANSYDGEMLLRVYLFSLPLMAFFAATLFFATLHSAMSQKVTAAIICMSLILLGGFLFTRYGNEHMDYMTYDEVAGVQYLYSIAPSNSLLISGWDNGPLRFQDLEKYNYASLNNVPARVITTRDVDAIVRLIQSQKHTDAFLIITRSEKAAAELASGLSPGALDQLEGALLKSGKFDLVYSNPDAQILAYLD